MRVLAVLITSAIGLSTNLHAQESRTPREPGPIAESADRIAREWWPTEPAFFTIDEHGRPRFRSGTTETLLAPPWHLTPSDPRDPLMPARGAISHQEMVRMMTPQEFSTPLIGVSTDPGALYNSMKKAWRNRQARRIHERVVKEVEELERIRAANSQKTEKID
jgi:hypothetical protein